MNDKIIWTKKELEDWHAKHPLKEFPPLALISASTLSYIKVEEPSSVQGTISNIVVNFPPLGFPGGGAAGLVSVAISLNDETLIPEYLGDNRFDSFLLANDISKGDIVKVIVKNADELWDHSIGVRVQVDEDKK
ncbi:unnamed protein product [marine sediment metagenome]|uniref:Uncharacterized protein n=1 Tax=marine sediment metagenome TaxID=412755 RepID=X1KNH3_9ZZZZ